MSKEVFPRKTNKLYLGQRKPNNSLIVANGMLESAVIGNNQGQLLALHATLLWQHPGAC